MAARELPLVPAGELHEVGSLQQLFAESTDSAAPIAAFCRLPSIRAVTPAELDAAHVASIAHCLKPVIGGVIPGMGGSNIMRNTVLLAWRTAVGPIYDVLSPSDGHPPHPERGWRCKSVRHFQGCRERHEVPNRAFAMEPTAPPDAVVYELPRVDATHAPIMFRYAGCLKSNMCSPHGIANGPSRKPTGWHTEPGSDIFVLVTHNTVEHGSAGFYIKPNAASASANYEERLGMARRGVYKGVHDDALLAWLADRNVPLTIANYITVACDALPVTWAGHVVADPLTIKGNGAMHNRPKLAVDGFTLKQGDRPFGEYRFPDGIRPPPLLVEWAEATGFKPVDALDTFARDHPTAFLKFFPDWRAASPSRMAAAEPKRARSSAEHDPGFCDAPDCRECAEFDGAVEYLLDSV